MDKLTSESGGGDLLFIVFLWFVLWKRADLRTIHGEQERSLTSSLPDGLLISAQLITTTSTPLNLRAGGGRGWSCLFALFRPSAQIDV